MANFQKVWAIIVGIILLLIGIIGFFTDSVFGIFGVNTIQNIVHLSTGLIFLLGGLAKATTAKKVNVWLGIIYLLVAILGFIGLLKFLNVQGGLDADNFLHTILGLVTIIVGFTVKVEPTMAAPTAPTTLPPTTMMAQPRAAQPIAK